MWIPTYSERDALVVLEIGLLFERISNTKFKRTLVFVPVELGEVVADEAMQVVSVGSVAPVAKPGGLGFSWTDESPALYWSQSVKNDRRTSEFLRATCWQAALPRMGA